MLRVVIVDGHPVTRYGVQAMLADAADVVVVAAVGDPAALPDPLRVGADVLICDPFPIGEARTLDAVRTWSARVPVLVVSAAPGPAEVLAAIGAGARGYLTKHTSGAALTAAVRSVAAGKLVTPRLPVGSGRVGAVGECAGPRPREALSRREQEALAYIARGFTHQQTATRMGVSKATVDTYVARIRTKLRVGNKAELALAALRHVAPRYRELAAYSR